MGFLIPVSGVRVPSGVPYARLAQLDRALGYEPRGREFESLTAYQWGAPSPQQMTAKMDTGMGPLGSD